MNNIIDVKALYVTITLPEYRLQFSKELSKLIDVDYCILNEKGALVTYGIDTIQHLDSVSILHYEGINKLKKTLVSGGYDILVVPSIESVELYKITRALIAEAKKNHIKIIYFNEHWLPPRHRIPLKKELKNIARYVLIKSIISKVDVCVASGTKATDYCLNRLHVAPERVWTAVESSTNPLADSSFSLKRSCAIPAKAKVILYLGRIIERKGLDILIRATKEVQSTHENVWLVICGTGEYFEEKCRKLAADCGLENVCFYGLLEPQYRVNAYRDADVFVLPSYFEGGQIEAWGLTVNEALEAGTPVIATTAVGAAYDLITEKNGVFIDENNESVLIDAIKKVLFTDSYKAEECKKTANKFSVQAMAQSFYEAMRSSLGE
jgi:glycosyltransferase involved in cell wall biosynthesis